MSDNYAIGADLGGTNLRAALYDSAGRIIEKVKTSSTGDPVTTLLSSIEKLYNDGVAGICIGAAGIIDRERGVVIKSPNLHAVEGVDIKERIRRKFSTSVYIENDANTAALGEMWLGAGRNLSSFTLLTLGTGIGGGIIYNGRLMETAAELGHITIEADGRRCTCGNNGCLESYASAWAMTESVIKAIEQEPGSLMKSCCNGNFYRITPEDIYRYALEGDNIARETMKTAGKYLGAGIGSIINIFSPEAVILAGGMIEAWDIYVEEAVKEASKRSLPELFYKTKILPAELRDDAGIAGSAYLVFQNLKATEA